MDITFQNAKLEMGQLIIDVPPDQRGAVMKFIRSKKNKRYKLSIQEYRHKRSLDANAYAWVLIGKLADVMSISPNEVYRTAIINIGGNYEVVPIKGEAAKKFKEVWEKNGLGWPAFELGPSKIQGYVNMIVTLCPRCHGMYDQGIDRKSIRNYIKEYLQSKYPDWDEEKLYYRR